MARSALDLWRNLGGEQRVAGVGAVLLIVSTLGPFSFVEAAQIVVALAVLLLLVRRAQGKRFHLPFGDGTIIAIAGLWCALLVLVRLFERPFGLAVFALGCCALIAAAGVRERARRPADDLPQDREPPGRRVPVRRPPSPRPDAPAGASEAATRPMPPEPNPAPVPGSERPIAPLGGGQRTLPLPGARDDVPEVSEPPELDLPPGARRD
jgi:hypothetical protein